MKNTDKIPNSGKGKIFLIILISLVILISITAGIMYNQNVQLKIRNNQLEADRTQISSDKEDVMAQLENCRNLSQTDHLKLNMLMEDYATIKKSCMSSNICNGKFPFMRYTCNAQGDAVDNGDKTCVCNENCQLQVT
jgi:hypothetical protein